MKIMVLLLFTFFHPGPTPRTYESPERSSMPIETRQMGAIGSGDVAGAISANQNELIQLARSNGLDLTRSDWIHKQVAICPIFSRHIFIRYQEAGEQNANFIAIYPRAGGKVRMVRQGTEFTTRFSSIRKSTIFTFNAVLSDERSNSSLKTLVNKSDWLDLARCYAEFSGELPVSNSDMADIHGMSEPIQLDKSGRIFSAGIEVLGKPSVTTSLSLMFDKRGLVERVIRTESDNLSSP